MYFRGRPRPNKYADKVDFMIFRENTEDVYAGHDFERGSEIALAIIELIKAKTGRQIRDRLGHRRQADLEFGTKRLVRKALDWAVAQKLPSVTLVHKGNIMKFTEGSFAKWGYELAKRGVRRRSSSPRRSCGTSSAARCRPGKILVKDRIADSIFQQIQTRPDEYSVIATAQPQRRLHVAMPRSPWSAASASGPAPTCRDEVALFEATHGTAPKYTGMDKVNPGSIILSAVMMLDHMGWNEAADLILEGIEQAIKDGQVTYDLARLMQARGPQGRQRAVLLRLRRGDRRADVAVHARPSGTPHAPAAAGALSSATPVSRRSVRPPA